MSAPKDAVSPSPSATLEALRASIGVLRWLMTVLVFFYLCSNVRIVGPNENGLVLRFGRLTDRIYPPGLLPALPRPIDEVLIVSTRTVQEIELAEWAAPAAGTPLPAAGHAVAPEPGSEEAPKAAPDSAVSEPASQPAAEIKAMLHPVRDGYAVTGDVNLLHAAFRIRYRVSDPRDYVLNAKDRDGLLRRVLLDAATEAVQSMGVDEILTTGQENFRTECQRLAQEKIDRLRLGVALQAWDIREVVPARQVLAAFEEVVSAKVEARTSVEKAGAYRQSRLPEIEARAFRIRQEADSQARRLIEKARGEAAAFLSQWEAARENMGAFRTQRHLEVVEKMMRRAWLPAVDGAAGPPLQLLIRPPAHDPEPIVDE